LRCAEEYSSVPANGAHLAQDFTPADGVDLIDEHDAGCVLLAPLEQVADAGCYYAYEHLNEIRAADRGDRHVSSLACASERAYASLASLS
jgi:hypothetical protein